MIEWLWLVGVVLAAFPFVVFFSVKLGRYAYLLAGDRYDERRRRKHGQAE